MKFEDIEIDEKVYSLVFGQGRVKMVLDESRRMDGHNMMTVEFMDGHVEPYTVEGRPAWCPLGGECITLYTLDELDLSLENFEPSCEVPTKKQVLKWRDKETLMARMPSGIWRHACDSPELLIQKYINEKRWHLFKKED